MRALWGHCSQQDEAPSHHHGAESRPMLRDASPVPPSPSFSSIFHSSCFLHKPGVSRDSSQMFSAAHHIAFLMKYSCSLAAFCHESLQQLPAVEARGRQRSCHVPGSALAPRFIPSILFLLHLGLSLLAQGLHPCSPETLQRGITEGTSTPGSAVGTVVSPARVTPVPGPRGGHQP